MKQKNIYKIIFCSLIFSLLSHAQTPSPSPAASPAAAAAGAGDEKDSEDISEGEEEQLTTPDVDSKKVVAQEAHETGEIPWVAPDFSKQDKSVGWTPTTFEIPPGFLKRVNFWIDIYTKYTTHQVLLHDAHYLDIVYKTLDFTALDADTTLNPYERERSKKKRIKEEKKLVHEQLIRIQKLEDTPSRLSTEDMNIYKKFRFIFEKNKFISAAGHNRVRMQLGQKDRFQMGIYFSGRYIREMERIFREAGVPMELTRLPFVESSFNLYAFSKVGASGIWQFMRSTGKLFKLKNDGTVDLRNDPLTATKAAAQLLKYNYNLLKSWPLALTAYNHGPGGVSSIVRKMKTDDINEIVWNTTRRRFGFASENFYAEFLAALEVESHADKYFGKVMVSPALVYEEVVLPRAVTFGELAQALRFEHDDGVERARLYNPYFSRVVVMGRRKIQPGAAIRIPQNFRDKFLAQLATADPSKTKVELTHGLYKIMRGDTLSSISRDFGISVKALREANNLSAKARLRPGQSIVVPTMESH